MKSWWDSGNFQAVAPFCGWQHVKTAMPFFSELFLYLIPQH